MIERVVYQVPAGLRVAAVSRLLGMAGSREAAGARRFLAEAPGQGVDLGLLWAWGVPPGGPKPAVVDEVALIVPGAGRVGMVFCGPPRPAVPEAEALAGLSRVIDGLCRALAGRPDGIVLLQSVVEPGLGWLRRALAASGFQSVGRLLYLRRPNEGTSAPFESGHSWPGDVRVVSVRSLGTREVQDRMLCECLDLTYEGTLDCPELFGLRETRDILASHRACGKHDPDLWWVALRGQRPVGCALLNPYPDQGSVELVYLGLAPEVRGLGLGRRLLEHGLEAASHLATRHIACAVDERNAPARRLYDRLGFSRFDTREAYVRVVSPSSC